MNIILRLWWSLGRGNPVVPSRWQATQDQLLRLQQILLLRELDLGLSEIATIVNQQRDQVTALRGHYQRLLRERDRLDVVARTVARTIDELEHQEGAPGMTKINRPENLFEGFDPTPYDAEARERWPQQWEQFTDTLSSEDTEGCNANRPQR